MQDKELSKILGIPKTTISDWKKSNNYRKLIYELLKSLNKDSLEERVEATQIAS